MPPDPRSLADGWLMWALRGIDGFASHVQTHARHRPLTEDERRSVQWIIDRLKAALAEKPPEAPQGQ